MRYEQLQDPAVFLQRAAPLLADEARHNLILGITGTLIRSPEVYSDFRLFLVDGDIGPAAAAVMTVPYNLLLADATSAEAVAALADGLRNDGIEIPGAIGNRPTIDRFVADWSRNPASGLRKAMAQGVFALEAVSTVGSVAGEARAAKPADFDLIARWMIEFAAEALPDEPRDERRMRQTITRRLSGETPGGLWIWQRDGEAVSLSGHGSPTGRGIRIGPVYTPPPLRGNGYASALVAAESEWLLNNGFEFCFLYTDLANPTSNRIYERIGYRQIAEAASYISTSRAT